MAWSKFCTINVNGGGPQRATLGLLVYDSQTNDCGFFVPESEGFRFIDRLSILEIINLNSIFHRTYQLPTHNMFFQSRKLEVTEISKKN